MNAINWQTGVKVSTIFTLLFPFAMTQEVEKDVPAAKVSFSDFKELVTEVEAHRQERLVDLKTFLRMSKAKDVVILDTRSEFRYQRKHLKGAVNLSFSEFTEANLAQVIPSHETIILIYCNNNFEGDEIDFASKIAGPSSGNGEFPKKPVSLALNIPTYINLYGYGYRNVYELSELVNVEDPRVQFEGKPMDL